MGDQQRTTRPWELQPSFDEFVADGSARLLRSAYLLTGDRDHAEELLQGALVRVARRWDVARHTPHAYAHRVLLNLIHDRRRTLSRRIQALRLDEMEEPSAPVADHIEALLVRMAVLNAIRDLPPRQREVVVLRFFADLSVADTATAIGATEGTVKTHTSRALIALREALTDAGATNAKGQTLC